MTKLIAGLYDVPNRHLPLLYKEEMRQRRKNLLINTYILLFTLASVSLSSYVVYDYIDHQRAIGQRIDEAQTLIDNQQLEQAMRVAVEGLPVDYDFPWRPHWTDPEVKERLALEDAIDVAGLAKTVSTSRPVLDPLLLGQLMPGRPRDDQIAMNFANAKTYCTLSS